jgi:hypothetical protein
MVSEMLVGTTMALVCITMVFSFTDGHHPNALLGVAKQVTTREGAFACGPASTAGNISVEATGDGKRDVKTYITQRAQTLFDMSNKKDYEPAELDGRGQHQGGRREAAVDITCTCFASTVVKKMDSPFPATYRTVAEDPDPSDRFPFSRRRGGRLETRYCICSVVEHASKPCASGLHLPNADGFLCTCDAFLDARLGHAPCILPPPEEHAIWQEETVDGHQPRDIPNCLLTENSHTGNKYNTQRKFDTSYELLRRWFDEDKDDVQEHSVISSKGFIQPNFVYYSEASFIPAEKLLRLGMGRQCRHGQWPYLVSWDVTETSGHCHPAWVDASSIDYQE